MLVSKKKFVWHIRPLVVGTLVSSVTLIAGLLFWLLPFNPWAEKAKKISVGASKEEVQRIMGEPTEILLPPTGTNVNLASLLLCVHSETWAYGQTLYRIPNFPYLGYKLRLFRPDTNDIAITFDSDGKVANVHIPSSETSAK